MALEEPKVNNEGSQDLIAKFEYERLLQMGAQDKSLYVLGNIDGKQAILIIDRGAFHQDEAALKAACSAMKNVHLIQNNDIYYWLTANADDASRPDLKLKLIYPCTEKHIKKYTAQPVRKVTETPKIYETAVRPWMQKQREGGRLTWVYNILEGKSEVEDVIFRHNNPLTGFVLLPDSTWDRKTMGTLHLLALVERRDLMSIRDLSKKDLPWLKTMYDNLVRETTKAYPSLAGDQIQLYFHYQPTYYHMHIHITNINVEPTRGQAIGKAITMEDIISRLESLPGDEGMAGVSMTYWVGEFSDLWNEVYEPMKAKGETTP